MSKTIYLPHVTRFEELFEASAPWTGQASTDAAFWVRQLRCNRAVMRVGTFLTIRGRGDTDFPRQSFAVKPTEMLQEWIAENVLFVEGDRLFFEILVQADGNALVIVSHGVIIGSYWLTGNLRVESLPGIGSPVALGMEAVYTFTNGFTEQGDAMYRWLLQYGLHPRWRGTAGVGLVIELPAAEVESLRLLQSSEPARFGNAPEENAG